MNKSKIRKRLLSGVITAAMLVGVFTIPSNATVATEGWDEGAIVEGNKIIAPADETEGIAGIVTREFQGQEIGEAKTYEVNVDLSADYKEGELFHLSLGFGTDAEHGNQEFVVMTQRSGDTFTLTSSASGESYTLYPGIYTYQWTVEKVDGKNVATFKVNGTSVNFTSVGSAIEEDLQDSTCVRYIWAFGRDVTGNSGYKLDRDLVMYKEVKYIDSLTVVNELDKTTPAEEMDLAVGINLAANAICEDGSVIAFDLGNNNLKYEWSYQGTDTVVGTESTYTLSENDIGKVLTLKVTGINGYVCDQEWTAHEAVREVIDSPTDPTDPSTPVEPENPADTDKTDTVSGVTDEATIENTEEPNSPKTGDEVMVLGYVVMMLAAAGIGTTVMVARKKN